MDLPLDIGANAPTEAFCPIMENIKSFMTIELAIFSIMVFTSLVASRDLTGLSKYKKAFKVFFYWILLIVFVLLMSWASSVILSIVLIWALLPILLIIGYLVKAKRKNAKIYSKESLDELASSIILFILLFIIQELIWNIFLGVKCAI